MTLSILNRTSLTKKHNVVIPTVEKVLQFGTGVLLRGLPDYFIHNANQQHIFNGSIVVIKSTSTGGVDDFANQDALFTHCVRGIYNGETVDTCFVNTAISRVLVAKENWETILELAKSAAIEIVISNTTEAGMVLDEQDQVLNVVPTSFPGKLLALLYTRYVHFNGDETKGWVVLPTELMPDNGNLLIDILNKLAQLNSLPVAFIHWMNNANEFCNTLVDRIVPGKVNDQELQALENKFGYKDSLLITSEPFALWAIEAKKASTIEKLSFAKVDDSISVSPSIVKFRELKLRLLNGTHTFSCAVALLAGFETVIEAMNDTGFNKFINSLIFNELAPCVANSNISLDDATAFSKKVLERFANPNIEHKWISIALNFEEKMKMRNGFLMDTYSTNHTGPAMQMSLGFAAFCIYLKQAHQKEIIITDYCKHPVFVDQVNKWIEVIKEKGMKNILAS